MTDVEQGFPSLSAPFVDIKTGRLERPAAQLIRALWLRTGQSSGSPSLILDAIGSTQGDILYRNAVQWVALGPGVAGLFLRTNGAGGNPSWAAGSTGTVTSVATGTGLTGGTITTTGTVSFAAIASHRLLANTTAGSAAPSASTISDVLDFIGATRGQILYRGAASWSVLAPGTAGFFLATGGAGADPSWAAGNAGTVTSVAMTVPTFLSVAGSPVTTTGTLAVTLQTQTANTVFAGPTTGAAAAPTFRALISADRPDSVTTGIAAAGSNQGTATALTTDLNFVTAVAAAADGVICPTLPTGRYIVVYNDDSADALNVYPPVGSQIDALGVNNPYSLPFGKSQIFRAATATLLRSTQLG